MKHAHPGRHCDCLMPQPCFTLLLPKQAIRSPTYHMLCHTDPWLVTRVGGGLVGGGTASARTLWTWCKLVVDSQPAQANEPPYDTCKRVGVWVVVRWWMGEGGNTRMLIRVGVVIGR